MYKNNFGQQSLNSSILVLSVSQKLYEKSSPLISSIHYAVMCYGGKQWQVWSNSMSLLD